MYERAECYPYPGFLIISLYQHCIFQNALFMFTIYFSRQSIEDGYNFKKGHLGHLDTKNRKISLFWGKKDLVQFFNSSRIRGKSQVLFCKIFKFKHFYYTKDKFCIFICSPIIWGNMKPKVGPLVLIVFFFHELAGTVILSAILWRWD